MFAQQEYSPNYNNNQQQCFQNYQNQYYCNDSMFSMINICGFNLVCIIQNKYVNISPIFQYFKRAFNDFKKSRKFLNISKIIRDRENFRSIEDIIIINECCNIHKGIYIHQYIVTKVLTWMADEYDYYISKLICDYNLWDLIDKIRLADRSPYGPINDFYNILSNNYAQQCNQNNYDQQCNQNSYQTIPIVNQNNIPIQAMDNTFIHQRNEIKSLINTSVITEQNYLNDQTIDNIQFRNNNSKTCNNVPIGNINNNIQSLENQQPLERFQQRNHQQESNIQLFIDDNIDSYVFEPPNVNNLLQFDPPEEELEKNIENNVSLSMNNSINQTFPLGHPIPNPKSPNEPKVIGQNPNSHFPIPNGEIRNSISINGNIRNSTSVNITENRTSTHQNNQPINNNANEQLHIINNQRNKHLDDPIDINKSSSIAISKRINEITRKSIQGNQTTVINNNTNNNNISNNTNNNKIIPKQSQPMYSKDEYGNLVDERKTKWATIPPERQTEKYKMKIGGYLIVSNKNNNWKVTTSNHKHLNERLKSIEYCFDYTKLETQTPNLPLNQITINDFQYHESIIKLIVRIATDKDLDHKSLWNNIKNRSLTFTCDTTKKITLNQEITNDDFLNEIIRISHQLGGTILWPLYASIHVNRFQTSLNNQNEQPKTCDFDNYDPSNY